MPYNNTPIVPPREYTGSVSLPLTRIKKIIDADEDVSKCSNNAAFVVAVATEMFIQYLVEQTHNVVKSERRPRRNIQYKDVANAVARNDNLEFLTDVVPPTIPYKVYKEKKAKESATKELELQNGQRTLDERPKSRYSHVHEEAESAEEMQVDDGTVKSSVRELELEMRGTSMNGYHAPESAE